MRLIWTAVALSNLDDIFAYIAQNNPPAAARLVARIEERLRVLVDHPQIGRPGHVDETREFVITGTPYIVPYRVRGERIEVLAVLHAARSPDPS